MNHTTMLSWLEPFRLRSELSAAEYSTAFEPALPRRTAINRLNRLREEALLERVGGSRNIVYLLTEAARTKMGMLRNPSYHDLIRHDDFELSMVAEEARDRIHLPILKRDVVGYKREFLESYQPNHTHYLPEHLRRRLMEIGRLTGMEQEAAGTHARQICQRLMIDLSWNSCRLEGNTYSLLETEQLLHAGESPDVVLSREAIMILNHKAAIEFLLEASDETGFDRRTIFNLHALLTADLLRDASDEGVLRTVPVAIGRSSYLPLAIPALIETHFDNILAKAREIRDPFEQAFFAMVHLPYLQPFIDGNKRVSRLAANIPLFRRNLAPLSFVDVPEAEYTDGMLAVYELNDLHILRDVFVQAYERSAQRYTILSGMIGEPDPFRVRYRQMIAEQVAEIIRARCSRVEAVACLRGFAEVSVVESDRRKFVAKAEETLAGIHEGNFARYRVRPSEFDAWHATWAKLRD